MNRFTLIIILSICITETTNTMFRAARMARSSSTFQRVQGSTPSGVFEGMSEHKYWNDRYIARLKDKFDEDGFSNRIARNGILKRFIPYVIIHQRDSFCKSKKIVQFTTQVKNQNLDTISMSALGICSIPNDTTSYARIEDLRDLSEKDFFPLNTDLILCRILLELKAKGHTEALIKPDILYPIAQPDTCWKLDHFALEVETAGKYMVIADPRTGEGEQVCKLRFTNLGKDDSLYMHLN